MRIRTAQRRMFRFERGLRPRNRFLGEASEGAAEAPSDETKPMGPYHRSSAAPKPRRPWPAMACQASTGRYMVGGVDASPSLVVLEEINAAFNTRDVVRIMTTFARSRKENIGS